MFILVSLGVSFVWEYYVFIIGCSEISAQTIASDLVQISPEDVEKPGGESVKDNINAKYANKVNGLLWKF